MRYVIDRMTMADIPRVAEIERLAYSSPWPTSAYRRELQENRWAHYIVARDTLLRPMVDAASRPPDPPEPARRHFPLSLLQARSQPPISPRTANIIGFAGLWLMVDEAHVTTIATHPEHRSLGVGELLLASLIDIAYDIRAQVVTLEVRVSNSVAQGLYRKYGFQDAGIRRRYYSDDHEDALIMVTPPLADPAYRAGFFGLKAALQARLGADPLAASLEGDQRAVGDAGAERR
ncbi:MAG TPA: ribosomal protein S18-alanine N-acetyltransferase [Ktedonobacterales bacterium]|nr:ribosomal protein S18-alanine N-acetyltransferase [Ktedonobacterales bacterium]